MPFMFLDASVVGAFIPIFAFAIPIVAIVGGIASQIAKTMARARIQELLIQERIKSIEKGIPPGPAPAMMDPGAEDREYVASPETYHRNRVFGLRLGGAITFAVGAAIAFALYYGQHETAWVWMMIPASVGACLIIASFFVPGGGPAHRPEH
jgi:hypothetical protein